MKGTSVIRGRSVQELVGRHRVGTLYGEQEAGPAATVVRGCVCYHIEGDIADIELTEHDEVFCEEGWKKVAHVKKGDVIAVGVSDPDRWLAAQGDHWESTAPLDATDEDIEVDVSVLTHHAALEDRDVLVGFDTDSVYRWCRVMTNPKAVGLCSHFNFLTKTGHAFIEGVMVKTDLAKLENDN